MKLRGSLIMLVIILSGLVAFYYPKKLWNGGDPQNKESVIVSTVMALLQQMHFSPKDVDTKLSEEVYKTYIDDIDGSRRFFTQTDIDKLKPFKTEISNEIRGGTLEFFDLSYNLLNESVEKVKKWYPELLEKPFDFTKEESVDFDKKDMPFAKDDAQLKEYWRKMLKYDVLTRLSEKMTAQEKETDKAKIKSKEDLEKESRDETQKFYSDFFKRWDKIRRADRFSDYVNAITEVFDPHTSYFSPKDKQDFDINMSGRLEGIGATLQTDGDYTKVTQIVPGGPAWKQKELEANDVIMRVQQEGKDPVDIRGMRLDDVVQQIRGKKGTKVTLYTKKSDGTTKNITIERDEVIIDESFAKSLIIDIPGQVNKIGYIRLPKFYADFENEKGSSCAVDVAKEIEKLKSENVNGIILDLRNNGGGSLKDVVQMSGLFIEQGPIVQVKGRNQAPYVMKDEDPTVQYDGPLVVMVNEFSASASEILAAAVQDYGRAVIVGSTSTFGKGTVQRFVELDRAVQGNNDIKPLGEIKITTQKFYRVNGGSTQLKGVSSDIVLPDNYSYIKAGEKEYESAMGWSEIAPVKYQQNVYKVTNMNALKAASALRVKNNPEFAKIDKYAKYLKNQQDVKTYTLNLDKYRKELETRKKESESMKESTDPIKNLNVINPVADNGYIQMDSSRIARNNSWVDAVKKDVYIEESMYIIKDIITNQSKSRALKE